MSDFVISKNGAVKVYLSEKESNAVKIAAQNLCTDLNKVCGARAEITGDLENSQIIIATAEIVDDTDIDVHNDLLDKDGRLIWEAYAIKVRNDGKLMIAGADRRGTIYGIYDFCESIGVSPWHWFADVPIKTKEKIIIENGYQKFDYPTVQYRGIFINDEEELEAWAKANMGEDTIGPETYKQIFELLLRLKGNYIWPAMHVNAFNANPKNGWLANEMGLVVGTSHCDMLLRSNQNEWEPWCEENEIKDVEYDYSIEGENRETIKRYWQESVEQNKEYDVSYTVGMRGIHDSGFITREIDKEGLPETERVQKKVALLEEVIRDQREIITKVTGKTDALQTFIPYKEVLSLYNQGLNVPEDITLIWVNDNFGYMRRYPNKAEQNRTGGNGLYYHVSYWGAPAMSYLFINSTPLAHIKNELKKSYENGIRKVWTLNVGAIKPLEQEMEFFLRYAWEIDRQESTTADVTEYTEKWINRNFSGNHGKEVADIYRMFAQVTNVRKLEHMKSGVFSQTAFGNEAARRMLRLKEVYRRTAAVHKELPQNERDAFLQLFAMKIYATYFINTSFYYADRSKLMYDGGYMRDADECTRLSSSADCFKRNLIHYYNTVMSDGKWNRILTPEEFLPPCTALYPACKPALTITEKSKYYSNESENTTVKKIFKSQSGYAENEGYISIAAEHFTKCEGWREVKYMGRFEGSVMESLGGVLEYELNFVSSGEFLLEIYRFMTLNSTGRIRFGICIDDGKTEILESITTDEWRGSWKESVWNNGEKLYVKLPYISAGKHTLKIYGLDKYVSFSKIVIYTKEFVPSNLGPCESFHADYNPLFEYRQYHFQFDEEFAKELHRDILQNANAHLPDVIYAGKDFWSKNRLYLKNEVRTQSRLGEPKYTYDNKGNKNVLENLCNEIFCEKNGVIAFGSEHALLNSENAYLRADADGIVWEHTQSETNGGSGIAMHIAQQGGSWDDAKNAPSMNYRIKSEGGKYNIWFLLKYDDAYSAGCHIGIDGKVILQKEMFAEGQLFNFGTQQNWVWMIVAEADMEAGLHTFSIYAKASELRIDRIYLTKGEEYPPLDAEWDME